MRLDGMRMIEVAEQMAAEVDLLLPRARAKRPNPADHLERSTDSALFNLGEGVTSYKPKVKIAAYEIARKETGEVRMVLRRLVIAKVFTKQETQKAYNLADLLVGMITRAILAVEKRLDEESK